MRKNKISKGSLIIILIVALLLITGTSFAYYIAKFSVSGDGTSDITTSELVQVTLDLEEKQDADNIYPGYVGLKSFTLKGSGSFRATPVKASILINPDLNDFSDYVYWRLYRSKEEITCSNELVIDNEGAAYLGSCNIPDSATLVLSGNSALEHLNVLVSYNTNDRYYLVIDYADKGDQSDLMDKSFDISVSLGASTNDLADDIIASLDTSKNCPEINSNNTVNASRVESEKSLVCSAPDAYGTSYYYSGNVTNNYVKFAGFYWRIVRINGDKSIRMIYDGTRPHENGKTSDDRIALKSAYNTGIFKNNNEAKGQAEIRFDNAAVGYMYGNRSKVIETDAKFYTSSLDDSTTIYIAKSYTYDVKKDLFDLVEPFSVNINNFSTDYVGYYTFFSDSTYSSKYLLNKIVGITKTDSGFDIDTNYVIYGTESKEKAQENINDSTIKEALDKWYVDNLKDYSSYLTDAYYCNNRAFADATQGYGNVITKYHYSELDANHTNLLCTKNDTFTVYNKAIGNGALTYPIGLLSLDEAMLAGGFLNNSNYYLYTGSDWWLMTPLAYYGLNGHGASVNNLGRAYGWTTLNSEIGVKPVINLKSGSLKSGKGTIDEPYMVTE